MSTAIRRFHSDELREKHRRYFMETVYDEKPQEKRKMLSKTRLTKEPVASEVAQEELDFDKPVEGESKNERFKRVANFRLRKAVERLRMLRQMFEGSTVNNYEFTEDQMGKLCKTLFDEVNEINRLMARRLDRRDDDIPQL